MGATETRDFGITAPVMIYGFNTKEVFNYVFIDSLSKSWKKCWSELFRD